MSTDSLLSVILELLAVERLKLDELRQLVCENKEEESQNRQRQEAAQREQTDLLREILSRLSRSEVSSITANSTPENTQVADFASVSTHRSASHAG